MFQEVEDETFHYTWKRLFFFFDNKRIFHDAMEEFFSPVFQFSHWSEKSIIYAALVV